MEKIKDYVTGLEVNATPEEIEAVQPLSQELNMIYQYPKSCLKTHPQFRICQSPGSSETYPLDITIFKNKKIFAICECKQKKRKDGIEQLKKYMNLADVKYGIWFNGVDRVFLEKIVKKNSFDYKIIPNFPCYDGTEELKKCNLRPYINMKEVFASIHRYIKAHTALTDLNIAENFIRILFCKIYDERFHNENELLDFKVVDNNKENIDEIFENVKTAFSDNFEDNEKISFDEKTIEYIVSRLQLISLMDTNSDAISDAFEIIVGDTLKGDAGQFFTPRNVIRFCLNFCNLKKDSSILDPACGTGGFIVEALTNVWKKIDKMNLPKSTKEKLRVDFAAKKIHGWDLNPLVSKIAKAYMSLLGDGVSNVHCLNSLSNEEIQLKANKTNNFDFVLTNPPFGKKIKIKDINILSNFLIAKDEQGKSKKEVNPEILFIEQCLNKLKPNGTLLIVLPEGILGNPTALNIRKFIVERAVLKYVIDIPQEAFAPHTAIKTSILILEKRRPTINDETILVTVKEIGHDKNGNPLYLKDIHQQVILDENGNKQVRDDFKRLIDEINDNVDTEQVKHIPYKEILENDNLNFYVKYYSGFRDFQKKLYKSAGNIRYISIQQLLDEDVFEKTKTGGIPNGNGPESDGYYSIDEIDDINKYVPFIRTSDVQDFKVNLRSQWYISKEYYEKCFKNKQKLCTGDLIFVKDGKSRVGQFAILNENNVESVVQSHLYILRVKKGNKYGLTPYSLAKIFASSDEWKTQLWSAIFIQGTIPTISINFSKLYLPIPSKDILEKYDKEMKKFYDSLNTLYGGIVKK